MSNSNSYRGVGISLSTLDITVAWDYSEITADKTGKHITGQAQLAQTWLI